MYARKQAALLLVLLALTGCAGAPAAEAVPLPEEQVRASAFQTLEDIRRLNQDPAKPMSLAFGREPDLEDPKSLLPAVLGAFTYRIDAVVLDEEREEAVVTVTLRRKNVGEALVSWMRQEDQARALAALPQEQREKALRRQLLEAIQAAPPQDCAVALPFTLQGGEWALTREGQAVLSAALRGE